MNLDLTMSIEEIVKAIDATEEDNIELEVDMGDDEMNVEMKASLDKYYKRLRELGVPDKTITKMAASILKDAFEI